MKKDRNRIRFVGFIGKIYFVIVGEISEDSFSPRRRRKIGRETKFDLFPPPIRSPEMHIDEGNSISKSFPSDKVEKRL